MSTPDVPMTVHAAREGDGYWKSKGEQWQLLCPHMSSTAKTTLGILCSLTGQTHPVRKVTAAELAGLLSKGPVAPGEIPKSMSTSGAIRVLRELADLGQLTRPDGTRLTISSRPTAELSICVWKRPRHTCECARNVHDALNGLRGESLWFPPASAGQDSHQASGPGENSDQAGEDSHQPGQNSAKTPPPTCDDEPPLSLSPSSSSLSGDSPATPSPSEEDDKHDERERKATATGEPAAIPEQRPASAGAEFVVQAYVAAASAAGVVTDRRDITGIRRDAAALLAEVPDCTPEWLAQRAAEMPAHRWSDLRRHVAKCKTPIRAPKKAARSKPCSKCMGSGLMEDENGFPIGKCDCRTATVPA